jgi:multisubunit Na+/H+ antiporter MnhB subunit
MKSVIFHTATQFLIALILLVSIFLLLRGHNEPGGGFVGGLVASIAFILSAWANSIAKARRLLIVDPRTIIGSGLLIIALSGLPAVFRGEPYLTALKIGVFGGDSIVISTPAAFDVGVYLTVLGVVLLIVLSLEEE